MLQMSINRYLPKVLSEVLEYNRSNESLDIELNLLLTKVNGVSTETLVQTATLTGISKWEKVLGIIPKDTDNLELRRFRVLNILTSKLPYTKRWLENKLNEIVGQGKWTFNILNYTLTIQISGMDTVKMTEIELNLRKAIPANVELLISGPPASLQKIYIGQGIQYASKRLFRSRI